MSALTVPDVTEHVNDSAYHYVEQPVSFVDETGAAYRDNIYAGAHYRVYTGVNWVHDALRDQRRRLKRRHAWNG